METETTTNESTDITKEDIIYSLNEFYENHVVDTVDQSFQIFRSFTYGEMVISFLLLCILLVMTFKWIFEVLR